MAIFNKSDKQADYSSNVTTVAAGSNFTGAIEIECSLHLDGEVHGDINSTNAVEIGETGVLKGDVKAQRLVVAGTFLGNAKCDSIELVAGGRVEGKLITDSLTIDSTSIFQGESVRGAKSASVTDLASGGGGSRRRKGGDGDEDSAATSPPG